MANNNNRDNKARSKKEIVEKNNKKEKNTKIFIISFAAVALLAIIVSIVVAVVLNLKKDKRIDYLNENLSKYVYISEDDYKHFKAEVSLAKVSDSDIDNAILKLLCKNKSKDPLYDGKSLKNQTVTPGDILSIKYRGYILEENGHKTDFSGGSNFNEDKFSDLEIGSGSFIPGFEIGLVGKNPADYSTLTEKSTGNVSAGDLIQLSYNAFYGDGKTAAGVTVMIDLTDKLCDGVYGKGFADFLTGKPIGETIKESFVVSNLNGIEGDSVYSDMKVTKVYCLGDNPLTVKVRFPANYKEVTLQGKEAYFNVFIRSAVLYDTPEFDDKFITDTLKVKADDLKNYKGETLAEKYKDKIHSQLEEEYQNNVKNIVGEALWDHYTSKAEFKKLPEFEVDYYYNKYVGDMQEQYKMYGANYGSFDNFVLTYMGLGPKDDWRVAIRSQAEEAVKEKLVFYYVAVKEGFIPDDEEYQKLYEKTVQENLDMYLDQIKFNKNDYKTEEEYLKAIEKYKAEMLDFYGEDYISETVYFDYAFEYLIKYAEIIYK